MDYKELIKRLDDCGEFDGDLLDDAATAIETLLAEREAAGWISVDDRLPENDPNAEKHIVEVEGDRFGFLTVLVYNGVVEQTKRFFCSAPKFGLPKTNGWEWASSNVTHWMPLPTPPDL